MQGTVQVAKTDAEKHTIYRLRYQVYIDEMEGSARHSEADSTAQELQDEWTTCEEFRRRESKTGRRREQGGGGGGAGVGSDLGGGGGGGRRRWCGVGGIFLMLCGGPGGAGGCAAGHRAGPWCSGHPSS